MIDSDKLDEYKLIVDDTARFSERRQNISNTYITVNSLLLAAIAFMVKDSGADSTWMLLLPLPLVISGILISVWWAQLIVKYKNLVGLRMDILFAMEKSDKLSGLEMMYHIEEKNYYPRDKTGSMLEDKVTSFSNLELKLPTLFGALYVFFGGVIIITLIANLI